MHGRSRSRWVWALAALAGVCSAACSAILGLEPPPGPDDDGGAGSDATTTTDGTGVEAAPADGGSSDATGGDTGSDAALATAVCASLDAGDGVTYSALAQPWDFFNTSVLNGSSNAFSGGAFDRRYVYFAGRGQWIVRYDTTAGAAAFDGGAAWAAIRVTTLGAPGSIPGGFVGAVFDGRYVYFVPSALGTTPVSVVARLDTQGAFDAGASWSSFDLATLAADGGAATTGFSGGVFDGRYVYFVPHNDGVPDGRVVRYDTLVPEAGVPGDAGSVDSGDGGDAADAGVTDAGDASSTDAGTVPAGFANPALWSTFDVSSINPAATGYIGGVFDGTSVYLVPGVNDAFDAEVHGGASGLVARYATDASFQSAASWSTFDMTRVNGLASSFYGGTFDGRYVYFAPRASGVVLQLDTRGSGFGNVSAWASYDLTRVIVRDGGASPPFSGTAFDGRFVYFVPTSTGFATVARYDTLSTFAADCAWSTVDLTEVDPVEGGAQNFSGAIFDGQYVYFAPDSNGVVARFNARTLPATPPFLGSSL